jgi:hypothetical protein
VEGIFGRDFELAAMERFLDSAPTWPTAVVIEGEAGIGNHALALRRRSSSRRSRSSNSRMTTTPPSMRR